MKSIQNLVNGLRTVIKYGAYVGVFINVLNYAIEQFEQVDDTFKHQEKK